MTIRPKSAQASIGRKGYQSGESNLRMPSPRQPNKKGKKGKKSKKKEVPEMPLRHSRLEEMRTERSRQIRSVVYGLTDEQAKGFLVQVLDAVPGLILDLTVTPALQAHRELVPPTKPPGTLVRSHYQPPSVSFSPYTTATAEENSRVQTRKTSSFDPFVDNILTTSSHNNSPHSLVRIPSGHLEALEEAGSHQKSSIGNRKSSTADSVAVNRQTSTVDGGTTTSRKTSTQDGVASNRKNSTLNEVTAPGKTSIIDEEPIGFLKDGEGTGDDLPQTAKRERKPSSLRKSSTFGTTRLNESITPYPPMTDKTFLDMLSKVLNGISQ